MKQIISMILAVCLILNVCVLTVSATKYEVPEDTNFYCCMDYRAITDTSSDQWKLQEDCFTDICGFRCYIDAKGECYYTVGTTFYYSENIGDTFKVTFENGNSIKVMVGDFKNPIHTVNKYGTQHYNFIDKKYCTNVIEFIVDMDNLPSKVKDWGTLTAIDFFDSEIQSIEFLGNKWNNKTVSVF